MRNRDDLTVREFMRLHVMEELTLAESYKIAFKKPNITNGGAAASAKRLLERQSVQDVMHEFRRMKEKLVATHLQKSILSKEQLMRFLSEVILTPVGKVDENSPLCQEFVASESGETRVKMVDKMNAVRELARLAGYNEPEKLQMELSPIKSALAAIADTPLVSPDSGVPKLTHQSAESLPIIDTLPIKDEPLV